MRSGPDPHLAVSKHTAVYQDHLKELPEAVKTCMVSCNTGRCPAEVMVVVIDQRRRLLPHPIRALARTGRQQHSVKVVALPAQLDETNAALTKAELMAAAASYPDVVVADMSQTTCCDWAGAGALVSAFGFAAANGTQLRIVLTDETVRRVLSLNGLDRIIPMYADVTLASGAPW
jgi:anti-anti-sigma factor